MSVSAKMGPKAGGHLPSITGARGLATACIVAAHLGLLFESGCVSPLYPEVVQPALMAVGWFAVQFFFALSGFVLTWTWSSERSRGLFIRCRLSRIYPTHVATALLVIVMLLGAGWDWPGKRVALANVALLHTWWPDQRWLLSLNSPSWTLASELFLYFVLLSVIRRDGSVMWLPLSAWFLLGISWVLFGLGPSVGSDISVANRYLVPLASLVPFLVGVAIARWGRLDYENVRLIGGWRVLCAGLALVGALSSFALAEVFLSLFLSLLIVAWVLAALVRVDLMQSEAIVFLRHEPWRTMGRYSFSIYLGHMPVIIGALIIAGGPAEDWSDGIIMVIAVMAILPGLTWGLRNLIEQPAYRWLTGREPPLA